MATRAAVAEKEAQLAKIRDALEGINRGAANARAGYVCVISNVGAFGANMVKVVMARRLEPMGRVRELGDASVPSASTCSPSSLLMTRQRGNEALRDFLEQIQGNLLRFTDSPVALEWH